MSKAARKSQGTIVDLHRGRALEIRGHRIGRLVRWTEQGPLVDFPENTHGPVLARIAMPPAAGVISRAVGAEQEVLLVFEGERADHPILVGLVEPQRLREVGRNEAPMRTVEALVDGDQVVVEGRDEIVLRHGEASITLRRNGRVVVRGTYVETRSEGVNRIRGGAVQIN